MLDFPIAPPIGVKDTPRPRRLGTLTEARRFVDEALAFRRSAPWRDLLNRLDDARSEEEAAEAIGALRELLAAEGLLESSTRVRA